MYILYIIFAIVFFGFLIGIHEFGHFFTAKLFKIKVNEFAIGMGPAIFKRQKGETLYALRCIPIGGYCAMEGEDEDSNDPRAFGNAKWWQKIIVLAAGATMNFLAGFLLILLLMGIPQFNATFGTPMLSEVTAGSSIEGILQPGDVIREIDGERIYSGSDITSILSLNLSGQQYIHDVTLIRDGEEIFFDDLDMTPRELPDANGEIRLRYGFSLLGEKRTLLTTIKYGWLETVNATRNVRLSLQMLLQGDVGLKDMGGPVYIIKTIADVGTQETNNSADNFWNVVYLGGFIAVNLGFMNLLPIPALDGGRIVGVLLTSAIEGITRKKLNPKIEGYIHAVGMVLLLLLMAFIFLKDIIVLIV